MCDNELQHLKLFIVKISKAIRKQVLWHFMARNRNFRSLVALYVVLTADAQLSIRQITKSKTEITL
jgi:hypothetical protein